MTYSLSFIAAYKIKIRRSKKSKGEDKEIDYDFIKVNFYIWLVIELIEIIYSKGLPLVWKIVGSTKTYFDFGIPTIHGFANAYGLVIITLFYYYYLSFYRKYNKRKNKCILYIIFMMLFYLSMITRQVIISGIIQLLILQLFFVRTINYKKIAILGIVGVIVFGLIGNLRTGYEGFNRVALMKSNISPFLIGISWVYMYLTMTVANINNVIFLNVKNLRLISNCSNLYTDCYFKNAIQKSQYGYSTIFSFTSIYCFWIFYTFLFGIWCYRSLFNINDIWNYGRKFV